MSTPHNLSELAGIVNGTLVGEEDYSISSLASLANAGPEDLSFLDNRKLENELESTKAGCVLVDREQEAPATLNIIRVDQPLVAWATALELFHPRKRLFEDVSPDAIIGRDVTIGEGGTIGAPAAVLGAVSDALAPFNTGIFEMPITPERIRALLRDGA